MNTAGFTGCQGAIQGWQSDRTVQERRADQKLNSGDRDLSAKKGWCRKLPKLKAVCPRLATGLPGHGH